MEIMTVTGAIPAAELGVTLPHEHVLVDFIGARDIEPGRYDADEVFRIALPHLERIRALGCRSFLECTPAYLGRDPLLLRRLSLASGIRMLTNTGYYGARADAHLPPHAFSESPGELAARWVKEAREGIDGTGIRPGFIKIGVDGGPLSPVDAKLVDAAARAHLETGLTIAAHTGKAEAAFEQLERLAAAGVAADAWVWVHAQAEEDQDLHARAAARGAWVELDGLGPRQVERHAELVSALHARGLLGRVLVSHDAGWYHVGEPGGGTFRGYDTLVTEFLGALRRRGLGSGELRKLIVENPAAAFAIRARRA